MHLERRKMIDLNIKKATLLCKVEILMLLVSNTIPHADKRWVANTYKADELSPKIPPLRVFGIGS